MIRSLALIVIILFTLYLSACAQRWSPFKNLRYDDQYLLVSGDTTHHSLYAKFKHASRKHAVISFGGEFRSQYFKIENEDWGETQESTDGFLLSRYLLHTNINFKDRVRFFAQIQGSRADWKKSVSPIDQNTTDIHQLFADCKLASDDNQTLTLRFGRQELLYGSQRLVSVREGPNYRQSFDALRAMAIREKLSLDLFYGHHVNVIPNAFNDRISDKIKFWGLYYSDRRLSFANIDFYYFGYHKRHAELQLAHGVEKRYSFGTRIWKILEGFSFDVEAVAQFGKIDYYTISAGTAAVSMSYVFNDAPLQPEIGLKSEVISGDHHTHDQVTNTFNAMFPRGGYFGLAALFGPSNLMDIHPSVTLAFTPKVALTAEYDVFWRFTQADGLYSYGGNLIYPGHAGNSRYIGDQFSGEIALNPNIFIECTLEVKWFECGEFLKEAGPGKDILFMMLQVQVKF